MEPNKRASLKDVAALAGTSISTVSRALNDLGYVAEDTRQQVLEAASILNYQPNLSARALRNRSSKSIGLVIPNLLNAYYATLADVVTQKLAKQDHHLLLFTTNDNEETERTILRDVIGHAVEGLLWIPASTGGDAFSYLKKQRIPTISLVRGGTGKEFDSVVFQDFKGSREAVNYLISLGHKDIGYIGGDMRFMSNHYRYKGYLKSLEDNGIKINKNYIKLGTNSSIWGKTATIDLLNSTNPPTALFVASNALIPGVISIIRQFEINIPKDTSLLCFDNIDWFSYSRPPISAIKTSPESLAESAMSLLFRRMRSEEGLSKDLVFLEIGYELLIRQSTAAPSK